MTGTYSDVNTSYTANTASTITGLGNEAVALSDFSISASNLSSIDGLTTGDVTTSAITITGTYSEINTVYTASGIDGLGDEAITASGTLTVAQANTLDGYTTGVVTATISDTTSTTLASLTGTGNAYTITVGSTTTAAADLNTIDAATTVSVTATAVTTLTGTAAAANTAYASSGITGLGNEAVTISDTSLAINRIEHS